MPRIAVRRARPAAATSTSVGVILVGLGLGLAAGFVLGEMAGPAPLRQFGRGRRTRTSSVTGLVESAQAALDGDLPLRDSALHVIAVGHGRIELHGWVNTRAERARAERLVRAAVEADAVINCVLVHGEDDVVPALDELDADELLA